MSEPKNLKIWKPFKIIIFAILNFLYILHPPPFDKPSSIHTHTLVVYPPFFLPRRLHKVNICVRRELQDLLPVPRSPANEMWRAAAGLSLFEAGWDLPFSHRRAAASNWRLFKSVDGGDVVFGGIGLLLYCTVLQPGWTPGLAWKGKRAKERH